MRNLILVLVVGGMVGCGEHPQVINMRSDQCLVNLADVVAWQHRISRLAADSARCAERECFNGMTCAEYVDAAQVQFRAYDQWLAECRENRYQKQFSVTRCGDTIWSTGCQGGGPDSVHCIHPSETSE